MDDLGNRMKQRYEDRTRISLPRRTYTIMRLDGRAFHTYTRDLQRPFDERFCSDMDLTARTLCENIQGAQFAYIQSDEISILLTDFATIQTDAWFDGNIQKMVSVSAAMATSAFQYFRNLLDSPSPLGPVFDSRVFTIPDYIEVENYFIWRQMDAIRNSLQMLARAHYSQKELHNKKTQEMHDMLHEKGVNWNDLPARHKRGGFVVETLMEASENIPRWEITEVPIFTQDRTALRNRIPRIENMAEPEQG